MIGACSRCVFAMSSESVRGVGVVEREAVRTRSGENRLRGRRAASFRERNAFACFPTRNRCRRRLKRRKVGRRDGRDGRARSARGATGGAHGTGSRTRYEADSSLGGRTGNAAYSPDQSVRSTARSSPARRVDEVRGFRRQ